VFRRRLPVQVTLLRVEPYDNNQELFPNRFPGSFRRGHPRGRFKVLSLVRPMLWSSALYPLSNTP